MELWLIISAGVCMALVMKRNNQSANGGASLERLEATLFRLLSDMKKQSADSAYQQRREVIEMFGALGGGLTRTLQDAARTSGESMDKPTRRKSGWSRCAKRWTNSCPTCCRSV